MLKDEVIILFSEAASLPQYGYAAWKEFSHEVSVGNCRTKCFAAVWVIQNSHMIVERIYEWANRQPDKTAVVFRDVSLSYRSFSNSIRAACEFFKRENLPAGRTAVVLVENRLDAWIIAMALRALGLDTIPASRISAVQSLKIKDVACIVASHMEAPKRNLSSEVTGGAKVVIVPPLTYSGRDTGEMLLIEGDVRRFGGHIVYTSGTTGSLKKLMMSAEHEDRLNRERGQLHSFDSNTILHGIDYGLWTAIGSKFPPAIWHAGGCVVFDDRKEKFEHFFSHGVNFSMITPNVLKDLLEARGPSARPKEGFAIAVSGGFLSIDLAEQAVQTLTDSVTIIYGSTETNSIALRSRFRTIDDLHWLTPTNEKVFQIIDENGRDCAVDQEGELRIQLSDFDSHHYLDDEETSARVFRDGFFYPGDMAVRRRDGRIRILGRTNDVIILYSQKFAAAPIEQAIQRLLKVDEVCLFSRLTDQGHEEVIVAIQSDRQIDRSDLEAVALEFGPSTIVRFSFLKEFPRTETGMRKTNRAALKKLIFKGTEMALWVFYTGAIEIAALL